MCCSAGATRRGELFERLLSLRNDVGLLAEEYDPRAGRMVGNFPQAFSHVALINTAHNLAQAEKPAEQRSGSTREPAEAVGLAVGGEAGIKRHPAIDVERRADHIIRGIAGQPDGGRATSSGSPMRP